MPKKTHNVEGALAADRLASIVKRIERLTEEKAALAADIREIYVEAKGNGFDTRVLRRLIKRRSQDKAELQEEEALLELYESALATAASTEPEGDE